MNKVKLSEMGFDESLNDSNFKYRYDLNNGIKNGRLFLGFSLIVFAAIWLLKG